jgi:hypothetical protein
VDPAEGEIPYTADFFGNYTSTRRNETMEPDPFVIVYPKRDDQVVEFDQKW